MFTVSFFRVVHAFDQGFLHRGRIEAATPNHAPKLVPARLHSLSEPDEAEPSSLTTGERRLENDRGEFVVMVDAGIVRLAQEKRPTRFHFRLPCAPGVGTVRAIATFIA